MSSSSSSSSGCSNLSLFETMASCADGYLRVYRRSVDVSIGDWYFFETQGCCGGISSSSTAGVITGCCPDNTWPLTLYAHFSGGTGDCTCLDNITIELTNPGNGDVWSGVLTACSGDSNVDMSCTGGNNFTLAIATGVCHFSINQHTTLDCDTFTITWENLSMLDCCTGTIDVLVDTNP